MNKKLNSWEEIKLYLEYILYDKRGTRALFYTSTSGYLQPFIDDVEKQLKALKIIKIVMPNLTLLGSCKTFKRYIEKSGDAITKEEYELLKEVLL